MKKIFEKLKKDNISSYLLAALISISFYMILKNLKAVGQFFAYALYVVSPVLWGAVLAYIFNPLANIFENKVFKRLKKRKLAHVLSVIIAVAAFLAAIAALIVLIIPQLISSANILLSNAESYFETFKVTAKQWIAKYEFLNVDVDAIVGSWNELFNTLSDWVLDNIDRIFNASYKVGSGMFSVILAVVFCIYMLLDKNNVNKSYERITKLTFKGKAYERFKKISHKSNVIFSNYFNGNLLDSAIVGVANFIFMIICGMPYPLLISVIAGVTNLIPTFGPIIGAVPDTLIILILEPVSALWFVIWTIALQLIDGNVIKPLLFGDFTGLRPLWVLAAIVIGGRVAGILGMLLGIPVFAVLSWLLDESLSAKETKNIQDAEPKL